MRRRHISVLAPISALVAVSMGLSACGGGSNEATPSPSLSAVTTARPSAAVTTVRPSPTGPAATASPAAGSTTGSFTVQASNNATLGKTILVDAQGITLYRYDKDSAGTSNCTGSCATVWPPLAARRHVNRGLGRHRHARDDIASRWQQASHLQRDATLHLPAGCEA